jgi:hypothetical protein
MKVAEPALRGETPAEPFSSMSGAVVGVVNDVPQEQQTLVSGEIWLPQYRQISGGIPAEPSNPFVVSPLGLIFGVGDTLSPESFMLATYQPIVIVLCKKIQTRSNCARSPKRFAYQFTDMQATNYVRRFYQVRSQ